MQIFGFGAAVGGRGESITVAAAALTERLLEVFSFLLAAVDPHISQSKFPSPELHIKAVARSSSLADRWPPTLEAEKLET